MTVKQFFKSTAFKCVVTLLCVLLVSGIFLTIAYGFLEVTDAERESRAISKIYGTQVEVESVEIGDYTDNNATIDIAYKVKDDGNYLVKATGTQGWQGGTVTCWVVVKVSGGAVTGVGKVVIDSYNKQTLMDKYNDKVLDLFSQNYNGESYSPDVLSTGATPSFTNTAITNAVNGAVNFIKVTQLGVEVEPFVSEYADFDYIKFIDIGKDKTSHVVTEDGSVEYKIVTTSYSAGYAGAFTIDITVKDGVITHYEIVVNGSTHEPDYRDKLPENLESILNDKGLDFFKGIYGDDMAYTSITGSNGNTIITGATEEGDDIASQSTYLCMYAGAFATANYDRCIKAEQVKKIEASLEYLNYIDVKKTTYTVKEDGSVEYKIVTTSYSAGYAGAFTIDITVKDGVITHYEIVVNGSTPEPDYRDKLPENLESILNGADLDFFKGIYGDDMAYTSITGSNGNTIITGATEEGDDIASQSTYLCMYAGAFATANYQRYIELDGIISGGGN